MNREEAKKAIQFSDQDRRALQQLDHMPGWDVVKRIMEATCVLQDIALQSVDPADEKKVLAEHRIDTAMWRFFGDVLAMVRREIEAVTAPPRPRMTDEERETLNTVDAVAETRSERQ